MKYSIDQFSKITGISKLVLRTWENRYDFLLAHRTKTNIRFYSDDLLVQALNTKFLLDSGYKISFVSTQTNNKINDLIESLRYSDNNEPSTQYYINRIIKAGISFDANLFNRTYSDCLQDFNLINFYTSIMLPVFSKIGLFWLTNRMNPAQEHFLSEMFKQKIYAEINQLDLPKNKSNNWLLFLPPNEHHEIGLLFSRFLLIQHGYNVIYLGANVPIDSLKQMSKVKKIDNLLFFAVSNFSKSSLSDIIKSLTKNFKKTNKFLVSKDSQLESSEMLDVKLIDSVDKFIKML